MMEDNSQKLLTDARDPVKDRDKYALVPRSLASDPNLTGEELRLLVVLMSYDLPDGRNDGRRKGFVYVSRSLLADELKKTIRWVAVLLSSLEAKQFIRRESRPGKTSLIHFLGFSHVSSNDSEPVNKIFTGEENLHSTREGNIPSPVNKTFTQKIRIEDTKRKIADDQQAPKKSKPKTSVNNESPDPRIRDLINCWCREWEAFYGQPYAVDWGADNAAFKHCLKRGLSFELLQAAIPLHIQDSDPFWEKMKSIRTFASPKHINRWTKQVPRQTTGVFDEGVKHIAELREREQLINQDHEARAFKEGNQHGNAAITGG